MSVNLQAIDLQAIAEKKIPFLEVLTQMEQLGNTAEGPLRVTEEIKGKPVLGIRTWKQFFSEHFFGDHLDIKATQDLEQRVEDTITKNVEHFLNLVPKAGCENERQENIIRMRCAIFKLRAKVARVDLGPKLGGFTNVIGATTMPCYTNGETRSASLQDFRGKILVPPGLSMGKVPIGRAIADRRFSRWYALKETYKYGKLENLHIEIESTDLPENNYYKYYKEKFLSVRDREKSIAIELFNDSKFKVTDANRNGAWRAASEFVALRKANDNPVSILLCLDEMPEVSSEPLKKTAEASTQTSSTLLTNKAKNPASTKKADSSLMIDNGSDDESEN